MFFRSNVPAFIWIAITTPFFLLPGNHFKPLYIFGVIPADIAFHFGVSAILTLLLAIGFSKQYRFDILRSYTALWAIVYALLYGIIIEALQGTLPVGRTFDPADLLVNLAGCASGGLFRAVWFK